MKRFGIILLILFILVGGTFGTIFVLKSIKSAQIAKIKEGWYVEVLSDYLNIRKEDDQNSSKLSEAKKGDVFAVLDMSVHGGNYWYKVEYDKEKTGWVCNPKGYEYLFDGNNPEDIKAPTIRFFDAVYYVDSIDKINYKHLEVTDDKEGVVVTHKVYHEVVESSNEYENRDQYWIQYTATDAVGKTAKKVQKIVFNKRPDESEVYDFSELER